MCVCACIQTPPSPHWTHRQSVPVLPDEEEKLRESNASPFALLPVPRWHKLRSNRAAKLYLVMPCSMILSVLIPASLLIQAAAAPVEEPAWGLFFLI